MTRFATIRLDNACLFDRDEPSFFQCVAPLARGVAYPGDQLRLDTGEPCEVTPFGALWDDGSYRTVLVRGWTTLKSATRKEVGVEAGAPPTAPASAEVKSAPMTIAGIDAANAKVQRTGSRVSLRGRYADGELWYQLEGEIAPSGTHLYWFLTVGWSNPLNPASQWTMPYPIELSVPQGMLVSCFWGAMKGVSAVGPSIPGWTVVHGEKLTLLNAGTVWGDGQAHCWRGAMMLSQSQTAFAALQGPLLAIATAESWFDSLAWGAFGAVPSRPAWWPTPQAATDWAIRAIRNRDAAPAGDPWHEQRYGLRKVPGATGDQMDFGLMNCMGAIMTGEPLALDLYLQDALQDSCRPTHFCEADGSIVRARNHPQLVLWDQRVHFNAGVSLDRLGKAPITMPMQTAARMLDGEELGPTVAAWDKRTLADDEREYINRSFLSPSANVDFHDWWGRDNQHWSSNLICCAYYLTGDPQLGLLLEHECETYLSQQNLPTPPLRPGWPTTGPDAARAVGRTLLAGAWLYLCTGRPDVRERITRRVELSILPAWNGGGIAPPGARPFMLMQTDGRQTPIPIGSPAWFAWQEGIAVAGLEACYRVTGYQPARDLATELARTVADYGWQWRSGGTDAQVANCVVWNNGADVNRDDPLVFQPADGTDFALWVQAATELSASVYQNSANAQRLAAITALRYAGRPNDGGPGRYAQWSTIAQAPVS